MADRDLVTKWLLDAEDESADVAAQIAWLREQRKTYSLEMTSGDWEETATSDEAGSGSHKRGISARANHDAIVSALTKLGATDHGSPGGAVIITRFRPAVG